MATGSLRRRLARLFAVVGAVTALLTLLTVAALVQLQRATGDRVDVYGPALLSTETLYRAYSDQESGLRGFLLADGREDVLDPYAQGRITERDALADLRDQLRDEPALLEQVAQVRSAGRAWRREVAVPAIRAARTGEVTASTVAGVERGEQRFEAIRAELGDVQAPVRARRDAADGDLKDSQRRLEVVLAVAVLGLLLIALVTWHALRRWVTEPLARLGAVTERVEGGELSRSIEVEDAPTEIAVLADQVDRMRMRILEEYAVAVGSRAEALRARELIEEQAEDLRRSNAELEQFAYVASHDLQEPLRKVASFCQLLERRYKGQLDERGEQYIEFAVDGAKRMQQLINDLLAFSRVGRTTSGFEEVDLEQVMQQTERQVAATLEEAGAVVTHDPLPHVRGEASLLVQLLQNMIANAVKFRSEAAPRVHIGVHRSDSDPDFWEFSCEDNGIGIDPQYEDKIFVIFQRLHGRDAYGGTGIGLAMCKKIVEHHGGRLWLDKDRQTRTGTAGTGSTFRWTLPVADPTTARTTERTADDAAARATG
jgi:signal transduction histidine kinase